MFQKYTYIVIHTKFASVYTFEATLELNTTVESKLHLLARSVYLSHTIHMTSGQTVIFSPSLHL